jgi:hypothetical protein
MIIIVNILQLEAITCPFSTNRESLRTWAVPDIYQPVVKHGHRSGVTAA